MCDLGDMRYIDNQTNGNTLIYDVNELGAPRSLEARFGYKRHTTLLNHITTYIDDRLGFNKPYHCKGYGEEFYEWKDATVHLGLAYCFRCEGAFEPAEMRLDLCPRCYDALLLPDGDFK